MESLIYEENTETPGVILDKENQTFKIWGKSFPEEANKFFEPIFNWLEEYIQEPNENTTFVFKLEYFNSASSTRMLEIFYILDRLHKAGHDVTIQWHYLEIDDDMLESGKEFSEMISVPVEFYPYEDDDTKEKDFE